MRRNARACDLQLESRRSRGARLTAAIARVRHRSGDALPAPELEVERDGA